MAARLIYLAFTILGATCTTQGKLLTNARYSHTKECQPCFNFFVESCDGSIKYQIGNMMFDSQYMAQFGSCYECPDPEPKPILVYSPPPPPPPQIYYSTVPPKQPDTPPPPPPNPVPERIPTVAPTNPPPISTTTPEPFTSPPLQLDVVSAEEIITNDSNQMLESPEISSEVDEECLPPVPVRKSSKQGHYYNKFANAHSGGHVYARTSHRAAKYPGKNYYKGYGGSDNAQYWKYFKNRKVLNKKQNLHSNTHSKKNSNENAIQIY